MKKDFWIKTSYEYEEYYETEKYGVVQVIDRKPSRLKVRFLNTGNEYWAENDRVVKGTVCDTKVFKFNKDNFTPHFQEFVNNRGHKFYSISKKGNKINIVFENTGYSAEVYYTNAEKGKVNDPYEVSLYGVAWLGEFDKLKYPYWKQAGQLWRNMIKRCYSEKDKKGYYGSCFVSTPWLEFSNFLEDISELDGFDLWIKGQETGSDKYNLDKDYIKSGNNIYSKKLCVFLPESLNKSMGGKATKEQYRDRLN